MAGEQAPFTVANAHDWLAKYLELNPYSKIEESEPDDPWPYVKMPWGDDTIEIKIPAVPGPLLNALNNVILPERFTAIWHVDVEALEIIYTAFPLMGTQKDMIGRKFTFVFGEKTFECEFTVASERLLAIAENFVQVGMSNTSHRNLSSFWNYVHAERGDERATKLPGAAPVCFWLKGLKWDEATVADMAMHLNFYMGYFDVYSPIINIFPPKQEPSSEKKRERYVAGYFPTEIRGREINLNLLHYWDQARKSDAFRMYLYAYQIIEHASFYFVEEDVKDALRRALSTPHISQELDNLIVEIMDSVSEKKNWDGTKMGKLLKAVVRDPKLIWREVDKNCAYFSVAHKFEGEFVLRKLIAEKETAETFCENWEGNFCKDMRDIRNALSHGKEQSMTGVIAPTAGNLALIRPWAQLLMLIAGEVMVYSRASI